MNKQTVKGFILGMVTTISVGAGFGMVAAEGFQNYFKDVPNGQWYTANIEWAKDMGLMQGTGKDEFQPAKPLTRAEMATVLRNLHDKGYFAEPKDDQQTSTGTSTTEEQNTDNQNTDTQANPTTDNSTTDNQTTDNQTTDNQSADTQATDSKATDSSKDTTTQTNADNTTSTDSTTGAAATADTNATN